MQSSRGKRNVRIGPCAVRKSAAVAIAGVAAIHFALVGEYLEEAP